MIDQEICKSCNGRGVQHSGPWPATKCNSCGGKGYTIVAVKNEQENSSKQDVFDDIRHIIVSEATDTSPNSTERQFTTKILDKIKLMVMNKHGLIVD